MSDKKKKPSPAELLDAIERMDLDDELDEISKMSDEEVAADVRRLGGDPDAIGARGAALAARLAARAGKPNAWQEAARARFERAMAAAAAAPKTPALPRAELLARIDAAKKSPRWQGALMAAFRKRTPDEATDEELRTLLDVIAELGAVADVDSKSDGGRHGKN